MLKKFFEDPLSELWLNFVHAQAKTFHEVVKKIEGDKICGIEVMQHNQDLKINLL